MPRFPNQDWITEAEALDEMPTLDEIEDLRQLIGRVGHQPANPVVKLESIRNELLAAQARNRAAKVGSTIKCAQCGKPTEKTTYHKVFCSNAKTHGTKNCKDLFHNRVRGIAEYISTPV